MRFDVITKSFADIAGILRAQDKRRNFIPMSPEQRLDFLGRPICARPALTWTPWKCSSDARQPTDAPGHCSKDAPRQR